MTAALAIATPRASAMVGAAGETVALADVAIRGTLTDLLAEIEIRQTYRNTERVNIEAVYTFPLPLDAVLLELEVEIGGRKLQGTVVEKKVAEEHYEDKVAAGDTAVMLEEIEAGLYTMNVGNLLPGEAATITFRYAILYRWADDRLRIFLPTTIAPRYGPSPHAPHRTPESSLTVENAFSLELEVSGCLRDAQFVCPSHPVTLRRTDDAVVLSLQQPKAVMDRDVVVNVRAPQATRSFVLCGADGEGMAAVASFQPFFPGLQQARALDLAIVIDCSGSMKGDSMIQAKAALAGILDALRPGDRTTLIAFGNSTKVFSDALLACTPTSLEKAQRFAQTLDADMGGTEIGAALQCAYVALQKSERADILLLTDGEVSSWEDVVDDARRSGHRVFTVGIGSAVSEAFVRQLAAETGGGCELVAPQEGMAERIVRHFERMRAPRAKRVTVQWPPGASDIAPAEPGMVFAGDTVLACASFPDQRVAGSVELEVETEAGEIARQSLLLPGSRYDSAVGMSSVARLAAAMRLKELAEDAARATALRYRLISPWTNWLVVADRANSEKAVQLPELRKVPNTLAAGWGGTGAVQKHMVVALEMHSTGTNRMVFDEACRSFAPPVSDLDQGGLDFDRFVSLGSRLALPTSLRLFVELAEADPTRLEPKSALELLRESGLQADFDELFRHAARLGGNVDAIAAIVVAELLEGCLSRYLSLKILAAALALQGYAQQAKKVLREAAKRAKALLDAMDDPFARELLGPDYASALSELSEKVLGYRALFDQLRNCLSRCEQQIVAEKGTRAPRNRGLS